MQSDRSSIHRAFLARHGHGSAELVALPTDASFRRYYRLADSTPALMLMDAPPPRERVDPFVLIAERLREFNICAPRIHAKDSPHGLLLLDDFGDDTFTRLLRQGGDAGNENNLYAIAVDVLLKLHHSQAAAQVAVPDYDQAFLLGEANLLAEWYLPYVTGVAAPDDALSSWSDAWQHALSSLPPIARTLVLRDYHVDNLMILADNPDNEKRTGTNRCGLLDFQDAMLGSPAYDLVSLLQDARRDVAAQVQTSMLKKYLEESPFTRTDAEKRRFMHHYYVLGAQRHAKVAGIFVRLARRDNKDGYLRHLPRVMRLLRYAIDNHVQTSSDSLTQVSLWLNEWLAGHDGR